jgi:molybdopterin converting factor small subunit
MKVIVKVYGQLVEKLGWSEKEFIIEDLIIDVRSFLIKYLGDIGRIISEDLYTRFQILINGKNIHFIKGLDTKINDGDTIHILPVTAGG